MWWTANTFKAAIRRVIQPPNDQGGHDRSSPFYFVVANDEVIINTSLEGSPFLGQAGIEKWFEDATAPTRKEWVNNRIRMTSQKSLSNADSAQAGVLERVGSVTTTWFR